MPLLDRLVNREDAEWDAGLAEESILLPKLLACLQQSLGCRACFAYKSDLPEKLTYLFVIARTHRCVRPAWIADVDSEMFHGRFHHRRQAVSSPFPWKQSVAARPKSRRFQISRAKRPDDLRAYSGAWRRHRRTRAAKHECHQQRLHRREVVSPTR